MLETAPIGRCHRVGFSCALSLAAAAIGAAAVARGPRDGSRAARQILAAARIHGGLIVHLGCGDGRLTAALRADDRYVVQGLDADPRKVEAARAYVRSLRLYGPVSVERFHGERLPYADNLVNLVVAEDVGNVAREEALRVLAPGGVLYAKEDGRWRKTVKPRPDNVDEWTHYLHDSSGNAVAHDAVVGPPRRVQWIADPPHTRSHEHTPSINALVSAAGRIFYIADMASIASIREPARWHLLARDAYNGLLLWRRPFGPWFPYLVNWGVAAPQLQRRLVAVGDRVYVTLGLHAPLSALDAATGETIRVYEGTRGTEEIVYHDGVLLVAVRRVTEERVAELEKLERVGLGDDSPLYARESAAPLVRRFRQTESRGERTILALEAATGRVLWKRAGTNAAGLRPLTLCAIEDRVLCQEGRDVVCLDRKTGEERWSAAAPRLWLASHGAVVCGGGETVTALSLETGETVWTRPASLCQIRDIFVVGGSLWVGGFKPWQGRASGRRGPVWGPYFVTRRDLATGRRLEAIEPPCPGHHHRCWRNKATDRYILGGRRGVEFIDLATGDVLWHNWVRGVCKYGVMPCNGLLYAPPHACGCYIEAKLDGFYALASGDARAPAREPSRPSERLERGPAYGRAEDRESRIEMDADWPTYRHDARRSGGTRCPVPVALRRRWQADLGGRLTAPTVAHGKVFVSSADAHRVVALDAGSGRPAWEFTAGARVDSPPTLYGGRAIFGCRDGRVYSVRTSDGALAWRLRAARRERWTACRGQLEAASPVFGSVLVRHGVVYLTAGRSSYLDGGIDLLRVRAETGEILSTTPVYSPDPKTGRQPSQYGPAHMPGGLGDILSGDDQFVYLRHMVFDQRGASRPEGNRHLFALTGFLDDTWPHRSYWIFGTRCSLSTGCSGRDKKLIFGRLLVFDASTIYGYGRANVHWSNQLQDAAYRLFALKRAGSAVRWSARVPIRVRAMVLAGEALFVAGPAAGPRPGPRGRDEKAGALLLAFSAADGSELGRCRLGAAPVFDGMAAAGGRLYISLANGRLLCYGG